MFFKGTKGDSFTHDSETEKRHSRRETGKNYIAFSQAKVTILGFGKPEKKKKLFKNYISYY